MMFKDKDDFIAAVVAHPRCRRWSTLAVAARIASYVNNKTGVAWPGIDRLAHDLKTDRRAVQRAIKELRDAGLLFVRAGGGRNKSNRYRIKGGRWTAVSNDVNSGRWTRKTAVDGPPELLNRTLDKKRRSGDGQSNSFSLEEDRPQSGRKVGSSQSPKRDGAGLKHDRVPARPRATYFPDNWEFGPDQAAAASASPARWSEDRARSEFKKFRNWHTERDTRSSDWSVSWLRWCDKGSAIAARDAHRTQGRSNKVDAAVVGVRSWYERQNAAYALKEQESEDDAAANAESNL